MKNYKILNSYTNQIVKLLNALGYVWVPTTNDSEASLLKAHWIIAESSGDIVYSSTDSFVDQDSYEEISLYQLQELVAQSDDEQGLISGADALRALADGKEVEFLHDSHGWVSALGLNVDQVIGCLFKLRLKPRTIKLELEIPAPFEPKEGDLYWFATSRTEKGYSSRNHKFSHGDSGFQFGAWRTEEEIKQVVAALRGIKG